MTNPNNPRFRGVGGNELAPIKEIRANSDVRGDTSLAPFDPTAKKVEKYRKNSSPIYNTNEEAHIHHTNSSALVVILSYKQKLSSNVLNKNAAKDVEMYIMKHMTNIQITNSKSSFGKTANISVKPTSIWWPDAVAAGDWMFVWMDTDPRKLSKLADLLDSLYAGAAGILGDPRFNGPESGLKFVGKVINVTSKDTMSPNGQKTINQTIQGQAFLEFATSVYYTYAARSIPNSVGDAAPDAVEQYQINKLDGTLKDIATKYRQIFHKVTQQSPDAMIPLIYSIIFGIESFTLDLNGDRPGGKALGTPTDTILLPPLVAEILNLNIKDTSNAAAYQMYELVVGLQKYQPLSDKDNWWEKFSPSNLKNDTGDPPFLKVTKQQLKGHITYKPMLWNNVNIWSILNEYLNPAVNEMYTALKINNEGRIVPTITVREKPFSTGLIYQLDPATGVLASGTYAQKEGHAILNKSTLDPGPQGGAGERTLYGSIPRWVINENMIRNFSYTKSESRRKNFVQVMGVSSNPKFHGLRGIDDGDFLTSQFINGNYAIDSYDIQRNGLRAAIISTEFDLWAKEGSRAVLWAKMNADWMFNGHLKAFGTVTLSGVVDPIAEGDNCEIRGIVFHIESVTHSISVSNNGIKSFTTTLQLSNGLIADSLTSDRIHLPPSYLGASQEGRKINDRGDSAPERGSTPSDHSSPGTTTITEDSGVIISTSVNSRSGVHKDYE